MAYDKLVDSAALDAGMTATANAIREKTGTTAPIPWDPAGGFQAAVAGIETQGGPALPTLTNPAAAADLAKGKQLIDGDGNVVTGILTEYLEGKYTQFDGSAKPDVGGTPGATSFNVAGVYDYPSNPNGIITRPGANAVIRNVPTSLFGDAAAADVAKGKTFTSAAGFLVEGTMEAGGSVETASLFCSNVNLWLMTRVGDSTFPYTNNSSSVTIPLLKGSLILAKSQGSGWTFNLTGGLKIVEQTSNYTLIYAPLDCEDNLMLSASFD